MAKTIRATVRNTLAGILSRLPETDKVASAAIAAHAIKKFREAGGDASLIRKFQRINSEITSATQWPSYLVIGAALLKNAAKGDVIECGCYKGASTAALSLLCRETGRKLFVCDSFRGLPADDGVHHYPHLGVTTTYVEGSFAGSLPEVKTNISRWGAIEVCEFVPGFFSESLKGFSQSLALGFFDVDLRSSIEDCIRNLWGCFIDGAHIFTDDSCDMDVVNVWFDRSFWAGLGTTPPGYIGSGCGIALSPEFSALGYTIKNPKNLQGHDFGGHT
jgi:hypothetical protein